MVFSFLYLAFGALLRALVGSRRGFDIKDIELLVLRRELRGICAAWSRGRSFETGDRALLVAAAPLTCRVDRAVSVWSRRGRWCVGMGAVRTKWRQPSARRGRPPLPDEVRELVRLTRENPRRAIAGSAASLAGVAIDRVPPGFDVGRRTHNGDVAVTRHAVNGDCGRSVAPRTDAAGTRSRKRGPGRLIDALVVSMLAGEVAAQVRELAPEWGRRGLP